MPRYDYQCPNGHKFEEILRMQDQTEKRPCPICKDEATQIITGGVAVHGFAVYEGWEQDVPSGW
jgi:putative FmdB family regulatory protein